MHRAARFSVGAVRGPAVLLVTASLLGGIVAGCGGAATPPPKATRLAASSPAPGLGTSFDIPYLDIVKLGLESLYNSANSYECYQTPQAAKCQMGGLGDLFRSFGSAEQKQQVMILQQLAQINQKLDDIKRTTDSIKTTVERKDLTDAVTQLGPNFILQTLSVFNTVASACAPGKDLTNATCESWLGTGNPPRPGEPKYFYQTRIGQEIHQALGKNTPDDVIAIVNGSVDHGVGIFNALANVVSNQAKSRSFFTSAESEIVQAYYAYTLTAELAYITLWTNYWEATPPSGIDVQGTKNRFIAAVQAQMTRFQPLPAGASVDMRTGLMWSASNSCLVNSLQSPAACHLGQIAGASLVGTCPPGAVGDCQLAVPMTATTPDTGNAKLRVVADTAPQSSWKVPTPEQVRALIGGRGSETGGAFLKNKGLINLNSEYVWTSVMWCPRYDRLVVRTKHYNCMDSTTRDTTRAPFRVSINVTNGDTIDNRADACNGGPCKAAYIFVRQPTATEFQSYGISRS